MATIDNSLGRSSNILERIGQKLKGASPKVAFACAAVAGIGMTMAGTADMAHLSTELASQGIGLTDVATTLTGSAFEQVSQYVKDSFTFSNNLRGENIQGMGVAALAAAPLAAAAAGAMSRAGALMEYVGLKVKKPDVTPGPGAAKPAAGFADKLQQPSVMSDPKGSISRQVNNVARLQSEIQGLQTKFSNAGDMFERRETAVQIDQRVGELSKAGEGLRKTVITPEAQKEIANSPALQAVVNLGVEALRSVAKEADVGAVMKSGIVETANSIEPVTRESKPEPSASMALGR